MTVSAPRPSVQAKHEEGEIVEVTLRGNAANVRLMDSSNFRSYRAGRRTRYFGGWAKKSPAQLQVPRSG
ncbi:MAG: DUF1883 domain-containing protein [Gemmatimonadota bacterium]|nr:MAG: DUF1883 domain-containing protein [Gemmatimonadota bacterium]